MTSLDWIFWPPLASHYLENLAEFISSELFRAKLLERGRNNICTVIDLKIVMKDKEDDFFTLGSVGLSPQMEDMALKSPTTTKLSIGNSPAKPANWFNSEKMSSDGQQ